MRHTAHFYQEVIEKRLKETFGNIAQSMQTHFQNRWQIDQDLYKKNISNNIEYLNKIIADCRVEIKCLEKYLRRRPPQEVN